MSTPRPGPRRYLVEWYCPDTSESALAERVSTISAQAGRSAGRDDPVTLLSTWLLPVDEVAFGLFAARSGDSVGDLCRRCGYPAGRISVAIEAGRPRVDGPRVR